MSKVHASSIANKVANGTYVRNSKFADFGSVVTDCILAQQREAEKRLEAIIASREKNEKSSWQGIENIILYNLNNINIEMQDEQVNELINAFEKKIDWLGWRIASEISQSDNGSYFNDINNTLTNELSAINLTLQEINATLRTIAEKD